MPFEHSVAWRIIFNEAQADEGVHLANACPVCSAETLCRYYALGRLQLRVIGGKKYLGPGSYWEWCSTCRSFEHMSGFVPEWWTVEPVNLNHSGLGVMPYELDELIAGQR